MRLWPGSNANLGPDRIARSKVHFSVTAGILTGSSFLNTANRYALP